MSNEFRSFNAHLAAMNNLPSEEDFTSLFSSEEMDVFKKFQEEKEPQAEQPIMDQGPIQEPELTAEEIEQYNAYVPQSTIGNARYSLDELEKDPEFQERASRFMEDIGRNEDIFEYLRDSDWSLTSAIARSMEIKDWSSQAKQDYIYLRDTFDNAELGGLKQTINLFKDATIDTLADPFTIAAFAGAALTGGASIGTKTAIEQALKQGIKKQAKAELRKSVLKDAKKTALFTAAEGAAWVGPHDYFLQKADVELDLKNNIDYGNTAIATAFGGVFGGAFGGLFSLSPFLNKQLRLYSDEDTIIKAADEGPEQLELGWKTEEDRRAIADDSTKGFSRTDKWIANSFGKYTTRFKEAAKNSETLEVLLSNFRYDWARGVFDTAVAKIDRSSFGESLSKMRGGWITKLNESIVKLDRTGQKKRGGRKYFWINKLDFEQNDQLYYLLSEDINARKMYDTVDPETGKKIIGAKIEQRTRDAAIGIRNLYNGIFKEAQNFNSKSLTDRRQYAWKLKDQGLIDNVEDYDLIFDALIDPKDDPVKNYFSRKLQHERIKNNPEGFEDMLKNYGRPDRETGEIIPHAMPNTEMHPKYITEQIDEVTGELITVRDPNGKSVDEEAFGTNFMFDENKNARTVEEAMNAKAVVIRKGVLDKKDNPLEAFSNGVNRGAVNVEAGTTGFMKERIFDGVPVDPSNNVPIDRVIAEFIDTDVENVLNEYITSASMIINRERFFGKDIDVYRQRYLVPIRQQLVDRGVAEDEANKVNEKLEKFYSRVTGIDIPDIYGDTGWRTAADWGKTAQTMAHLPLATLSSITEPLILLTRVGYTGGPRAGLDVAQALVKESKKMGERIKNATKRQFGLKTQGTKDVTDEVWKEAYQVGLALEQAVHDRLAGLYGEIHSNTLKRANRGFFKATLLQQWTSAVQLAAFTTGKRQIRQHAELLAKGGLSDTRRNRLIGELRELGVDETKAVRWYNNSLDEKGVFNETLSKEGDFNRAFYNNQYTGGANRFSREIILNPDVTEANKPLWYTHPAGMILMQFASYPTAFNNTILKRYGREISRDITDGTPHVATPKILATALLMTNAGILTNAARSQGKSLEKEDELIVLDGIDRWGGLGPLNHAYRYYENTQRGSGPIGGFAKAGAGPLLQDLLDSILYRKGLAENVATNLPFYSTYDLVAAPFTGGEGEARKAVRDAGKEIDKYIFEASGLAPKKKPKPPKKRKPRLQPFDKGGLVEDVPQVPEEPDERIDKMTGLPYNIQAGILGQDEEDRAAFAEGGQAEARQTEQTELHNTVSKKIRRLAPIYKDKEPLSTYTEEELADFKKGITVPVYRNIKENTEEQNLIDFRESEIIGVHVSSSPESYEALEGYVRLNNPLDISDNDVPLEGFAFLEEIENNPEFKDKIVTDSMLPDQTAKEIVEDILFEHGLIKRAIKGKEETPTLSKLLNINASYEIRESFKDLGFDSIVYSQGNTVDDQMEDLGMREGFSVGGLISKLSRRITNLPFKQTRKQLDAGLKTQTSRNYAAGKQGDYFIEGDYIYVLTEDPYEKSTAKILKEDFKAEGYKSEKELTDIFSKFKYDQKDTMFVHKFERYRKTKKAAGKKAVVFDNNQYKPVQKVKPEETDPRTLYIFADNATKKYKKGSIADRASKMPNGFGVTVSRADVSNFKTAKVTDYFRDANYVTEGTMLRGKDLLVSENLKFIHRDIKKIIEAYASGNFDSIQISPDFYRAFKTGYSPLTAGIVKGKINQVKKLEKSKPSYVSKAYPRILKDIIGIQAKPVSKRVYLEPSKSGKSWTVIDPKKDVLYDAQQKPYQMIEQYFDPKKADLWKKETPAFVPGTTIPSKKGVTQSGLERYDIDKRPRKGMYDQDLELKEVQRELEFDNPYLAAKSRIDMYTDPTKNEYNPDMADQIIAEYFPGADSVDDILKLDDATISAFGQRLKQIGGEGKLGSSKRKQQFNEVLKYIREEQRQKKARGGKVSRWFYPLQKLFGYEVSPEDDIAVVEAQERATKAEEELFKRQERTEDMRYIPSWERIPLKLAERENKQATDAFVKEQKRIMKGDMSMRDVDILISQQQDPNVREYQEKAVSEKRFQDAMFRIGLGPTGQSADSTIDSRMPRIKSIQKQEGITPNKLQALVVKEIDRFNQNMRVPTKSAHFKGAIPDPERIMGDKYDPDKDYNWENTRGLVTILDETEAEKKKRLIKQGSYARSTTGAVKDSGFNPTSQEYDIPERIEWREPVTRDDKMTIAHEQLHRFIHQHPSGKPFRDLQGNHELFVRAYTHLLDGGKLSDFTLEMDLESASRNYKDVNLKKFIKKMPEYIDAFERAVVGGVDYGEQYIWEDSGLSEIIVTAPRRKKQMENLLSSNKEIEEIEVKAYKKTGERGRPAYEYAIEMLGEDELDKLFLKEIAFVESKWANDDGTFRPNNRSAYQISRIRFDEFKETNNPESKRGRGLRAYTKKIKDRWNIDLSNIEYDDLNDPIIATAVTRALLKLSPEAIGKTPKERARQWKSFWNTEHKDAKGTVEKYLSDVAAMENYPVKRDLLGSLLNKKK